MKEDDLTKDANMMLALQNEIPVLMKLYQALPSFPHNLMDPIIDQSDNNKTKKHHSFLFNKITALPLNNQKNLFAFFHLCLPLENESYIVQTKVQREVYAQRRVMDIPLFYLVFLHYFVNMVGDIITITKPSELYPLIYRLFLWI